MTAREATFQVERFDLVPAGAGMALIELDGRWLGNGRVPGRELALVVEHGEERLRFPPLPSPGPKSGEDADLWAGAFAVRLGFVSLEDVVFVLEAGPGLSIELPPPRVRVGEAPLEGSGEELERIRAERAELERRLEEEKAGGLAAERNATVRANAEGRLKTDEERVRTGTTELKERLDVLARARAEAERREESAQAQLRSVLGQLDAERGRRADAEAAASELADLLRRARANRTPSHEPVQAASFETAPLPQTPHRPLLERAPRRPSSLLRGATLFGLAAMAAALTAIVLGAVRLPL